MSTTRQRILIVEDTADISDLLVIRMELAGYTTCVAKDVESAIAAVQTFKPHGVLLDIGLPGGDGFEVLRTLKTDRKTKDIPVLMLTARQAMEDVRKALVMGARDYVSKPFDDQKLLVRVARMLSGPAPRLPVQKPQASVAPPVGGASVKTAFGG